MYVWFVFYNDILIGDRLVSFYLSYFLRWEKKFEYLMLIIYIFYWKCIGLYLKLYNIFNIYVIKLKIF